MALAFTCMTLAPHRSQTMTYMRCCKRMASLDVVLYEATLVGLLLCHRGCTSDNLAIEQKVDRRWLRDP